MTIQPHAAVSPPGITGGRGRRTRPFGRTRPGGVLLIALLFLGPLASEAAAQEASGWRKWVFALAGAAVIGVPAAISEEQDDTFCGSRACMVTAGAALGATVGFLIGRELDAKSARDEAVGPRIRFDTEPVLLDLTPEGLALYEEGAVVVGSSGLALVDRTLAVRPLAGEMRGIRAVAAFPAHDALIAATPAGLFAFTLSAPDDAAGKQLDRETASVLESLGRSSLLLARGAAWRRARLSGRGGDVTLEAEAEAATENQARPIAAEHASFAGVVWTLAGERLVARTAAGLNPIGTVALPAPGRSISLDGTRALIAAGGAGLFLVDVAEPGTAKLLAQIKGVDFAFDGVLEGNTAYVAAGGLGLLTLDLTDPLSPKVTGVARELGFVADIEKDAAGRLWVLDRQGARLHVVELRTGFSGS